MSEEYWIWLQLVLGFSSIKLPYIINHFGNAKTFYEASESDKIRYSFLNENEIKRLHSVPRKYVNDIINECNESNINIITPDSLLYPQRVLNIDNPPAVLYCKGEMPKIDSEVVVTIVGPRKPSEFGKRYGFKASYSLALAGCIIVSGGAIGIDSMAHYGAIESGGKTVAVLGCGINNNYLLANENLREKISCNGCLLSEYPPQMNASKYSFPQRNRLLSALGLCTVVIEAGEKSGTLITANCAAEQGRDVFVVPGNPSSPQYKGSNKLINDGAKLLLSPATVLEEYIDKFNINYDENLDTEAQSDNLVEKYLSNTVSLRKEQKQETKVIEELKKQELDESLSKTAATIYKSILKKQFCAEDIISQTGIDLELVILAITELEINGLARALPGGMYSLL